ncbi:hypothetical protein GCM10025867_31840 [Frondihabitans sucicola]|uniref:Chorismate-utilising enzyme C-terminal domain-containing protein n=1 Tax=Frondihabitans sucicola TaxID=1268041 RepID=A0ABN6Y4S2_9MICO|nr:anthranilate synthase component I family protein [Frondihabitans sucicola]BDZ50943.1 hypothetical protein GCM10025867_31840 [Frondihabitans sucicola]
MRNVTRVTLGRWIPAETVLARLGDRGDVVWFDAGVEGDARLASPRDGHPRVSYLGWGDEILLASAKEPGSLEAAWRRVSDDAAQRAQDHEPLGWWGWVGYGAGADLLAPGESAWAQALGDPAHPDLALLAVDRALVFDHDAGLVELVVDGDHTEWVAELLAWWSSDSEGMPPAPGTSRPRVAEWADSDERYLDLIANCQAAIHEGDAFVMCLTTSVSVRGVDEDDLVLYGRLRRSSPAPRACFLRLGGVSLLGSSPETFLTVDPSGVVTSAPIKGTRPRDADPRVDAGRVGELRTNPKERAENLMIVDLMRNDLSRVCVPGGVEVTALFEVHSYEHVHQLVSTLSGRLRPGLTGVDAVRATFPPGSMTGAPKHSVVRLLSAWETAPRGVYSGAVGRFGLDGSVDLSVVIRSIVLDVSTGTATIGVGGGITASSVPLEELAETRTKAAALLAVVGADTRVPDLETPLPVTDSGAGSPRSGSLDRPCDPRRDESLI